VVDAGGRGAALVNAAQGADKSLIADVRVFDEFIGGSLGEGKKSIALTVHLQPTDRTLTEDEIDAVAAKVVEKVTKATRLAIIRTNDRGCGFSYENPRSPRVGSSTSPGAVPRR
jgi:phenylalanyl-tRNA synthetase beta subunit